MFGKLTGKVSTGYSSFNETYGYTNANLTTNDAAALKETMKNLIKRLNSFTTNQLSNITIEYDFDIEP